MTTPHRRFPKIRLQDLSWPKIVVLIAMIFVTWLDDATIIGEVIDPFEIAMDALMAFWIGKRATVKAMEREGMVVEGKVVKE